MRAVAEAQLGKNSRMGRLKSIRGFLITTLIISEKPALKRNKFPAVQAFYRERPSMYATSSALKGRFRASRFCFILFGLVDPMTG